MIDKEHFIALAQHYLDGTLDEAGARELVEAIETSDAFRESLRTQAAMNAVLSRVLNRKDGAITRRVRAALRDPHQKKGAVTRIMDKLAAKSPKKVAPLIIPVTRRSGSRNLFYFAAAAAAVAILPAILLFQSLSSSRPESKESAWTVPDANPIVAVATPLEGNANIIRNGKLLLLTQERPLLTGDTVSSSPGAVVNLSYPDKTSVRILGESILQLQPVALNDQAGIAIDLMQGEINASVLPQPPEKPMRILTPQGMALVVGTRFKLNANPTRARLDVFEGKVRFGDSQKSQTVMVEKGQYAELGAGIALDAAPYARDPALWPFKADSPWNYPLGSGAAFAPIESPRFDPANRVELIANDYAIPIYISSASDPERLVYRTGTSLPPKKLRMPAFALPDPSPMKLMNIVDEHHDRVYELIGADFQNDGTINLGRNSFFNSVQDLGVFSDNRQHGTRIYGGSSMGGIVRTGELRGGIRHALGVGVVMSALNGNAPGGRPYVWPASNALAAWEKMYGHSGNLHLGSLLAIPPTVDIRSIGISATGPAHEIARALQDYGAYVIEHSEDSNHDLKFYFEPAAKAEIPAQLDVELAQIMKYLKVITNNSAKNVGGGGRPRRAFAPPFAAEFVRSAHANDQF